ncbi:SDR family oxidoreductase [Pseudonocardia sp. RS010]|uniref:SDR family oxidoreductase n=1 Tax=Pseudonocardia sp. RS010 TaxID=3385979 RepID=UPI0039A364FF
MSSTTPSRASIAGRTVLMSGGSRGIGLAIARRLAREGANIAFLAKTDTPHPRLPGTVHTAAADIEAAGGRALPVIGDVRDAQAVAGAVEACVKVFGGIDVVVNNASAIDLRGFGELDRKRLDLMLDVNVRGTYTLVSQALPHLLDAEDARVLTLSPPLNPDPRWLATHAPYTVSKYAMTMLTLGVAHQFPARIAASCLWPETLIATAAVSNVVAGELGMRAARRPEIMADAAHVILSSSSADVSGRCLVDAAVLRAAGMDDLDHYAAVAGTAEEALETDLFIQ